MGPLVVFGASVLFSLVEQLSGRTPTPQRSSFAGLPGAGAADVLWSAALAPAGSWTQRNVLQAGASDSWQRRVAGTAGEADLAVLRAARPGIASSSSGPISSSWSRAPWGSGLASGIDVDAIADQVADQSSEFE